jgi:hypothetical protein
MQAINVFSKGFYVLMSVKAKQNHFPIGNGTQIYVQLSTDLNAYDSVWYRLIEAHKLKRLNIHFILFNLCHTGCLIIQDLNTSRQVAGGVR